ncbi:MAG: RecX family transcriptional regulator [Bacteroidales bacterium]|nr:RecX family transcriptional regulator [Bacteroidales bacterium]
MNNKRQILEKILKKIKKREYSEHEIKELLKKENISENEKEEILQKLLNNNFINNERFVAAFVNDKFYLNKWGKEKIIYFLKHHHKMPENIIQDAINKIPETEYFEVFKKLAISKMKTIKDNNQDAKTTTKILKFLLSRGVAEEDAIKIINSIFNAQQY